MSIQGYSTSASRNLIRAAQDMLAHAAPITVLGDFGTQREMPQNSTDTLVFRRTLPFAASTSGTTIENTARYVGTPQISAGAFILGEGATPAASTISFQDVTVQLQQYGLLFKFTSKVELMYEDDIPSEMVKITGETMAEVLELVRYGVPVRIIDSAAAPSQTSKALAIWARTLELLDRGGMAAPLIEAGLCAPAVRIAPAEAEIGRIDFSALDSRYPFALLLPQSDTERLLEARLTALGGRVEAEFVAHAVERAHAHEGAGGDVRPAADELRGGAGRYVEIDGGAEGGLGAGGGGPGGGLAGVGGAAAGQLVGAGGGPRAVQG